MPHAEWVVLSVAPPGVPPENAGVLLVDLESGTPYRRFRRDLSDISPENNDYLEALEEDLALKAHELGPRRLIDYLEDSASGFIRVTDREQAQVEDLTNQLRWLYHRNIQPKVLPFRTHLPVYALEAAAGRWGPERDVSNEPESWIEVPPVLRRLTEDMFVVRVTGRSMEPLIPAGSLCAFRGITGTRQNRRVLVVNYGEAGEQRFTVKRYESVKRQVDEERSEQTKIILHPLNPEYEAWEIDYEPFDLESSGRIRVLGEFVSVIEE